MNEANLIGRLGKDPEIKYKEGEEGMFAVVSIATSEKWKDSKGEKRKATEWHRVVLFRRLAEIARDYLKKGALVRIRGRIHTNKWEDESGNARYSTEIIGRELEMLPSGNGKMEGAGKEEKLPETIQDDDIPF